MLVQKAESNLATSFNPSQSSRTILDKTSGKDITMHSVMVA
jgi:hypothetical protein